jgi:REP element-mobilizing transposase RayT
LNQPKRRRNTYRLPGHDYSDESYAYFITLNAKVEAVKTESPVDPQSPFTSCPPLGDQAIESLLFYRRQGKWLLFAYCLMPDHLHILVSPHNGANLSTVLGNYASYTTQTAWNYGVIGKLWQRSFYDHILRSGETAPEIVAYILDNPVRAELVEEWEDWAWCGMPDPL